MSEKFVYTAMTAQGPMGNRIVSRFVLDGRILTIELVQVDGRNRVTLGEVAVKLSDLLGFIQSALESRGEESA